MFPKNKSLFLNTTLIFYLGLESRMHLDLKLLIYYSANYYFIKLKTKVMKSTYSQLVFSQALMISKADS